MPLAKTLPNSEFQIQGINHLALVCRDMAETVDFYQDVLGMPLVKTLELPNNMGQHFFFDCGNGDSLAFFWFPNAPEKAPGIASPVGAPGVGELTTAHGSMNHVAFDVPADKIEEYVEKLKAKGLNPTRLLNHDDSPFQVSRTMHPGVFVRSVYFMDPTASSLSSPAGRRLSTKATSPTVRPAPPTRRSTPRPSPPELPLPSSRHRTAARADTVSRGR